MKRVRLKLIAVMTVFFIRIISYSNSMSLDRLSNYMANDVSKRAYLPRAKNLNDDSALGGYEDRFNIHHAGSHKNEEDEVYSREAVRQMVATEDHDSMHEENASPFGNHHVKGHSSNEEIINTDDDKNDDSSVEGYRTPFQNHQEARANTEDDIRMGLVLANKDDDTVTPEEHEVLANLHETDRSYPFDFSENDDSSIEGYRTPFKNHQEAQTNAEDDERMGLALANENDDTEVSIEHELLENQYGKDRSRYPALEVLSKRARLQIPCSHCCKYIR